MSVEATGFAPLEQDITADARRDDLVIVLGPARVVDSVTVSATRIDQALVMCRRA